MASSSARWSDSMPPNCFADSESECRCHWSVSLTYAVAQWVALVMLAMDIVDRGWPVAPAWRYSGSVHPLHEPAAVQPASTEPGAGTFAFEHYLGLRCSQRLAHSSSSWPRHWCRQLEGATLRIVALLAVGKCCEAVSDVVHGALMRRGRFGRPVGRPGRQRRCVARLFRRSPLTSRGMPAGR